MATNDDFVLDVIKDVGLVNSAQIQQATDISHERGISVIDAIVQMEICTHRDILQAVAGQYGMEVVHLADYKLSKEIIETIPAAVAKRYRVIPVTLQHNTLLVAISEPQDIELVDTLRHVLHRNLEFVAATRDDIDNAISQHYGTLADMENIITDPIEGNVDVQQRVDADEGGGDVDAPIIRLVHKIIIDAQKKGASDIHLEPLEKKFRVRYRVDGVLAEFDSPHKRLQAAIVARIKIMSNMSIAEKRMPQDGRIQMSIGHGKSIDLRVSTVPTSHGESVVMRILDKTSLMLGLPELGFIGDDLTSFERLINLPDGILLVTGPTGSGKTTTLYGCLNFINKPSMKIITVEDPVEYELSGINQVHVNEDIGMSFSAALRAMLRQAPNVIMVGEIRDVETANIAINASLTGHLVFSTLHTNDAPSAITRLIDIGVKPFLCASSIRAIIAQRLIRKICSRCKQEYTPTEAEVRTLCLTESQLVDAHLAKGGGCETCNMSGYKGRMGIFEIFIINDEIKRLIYEKTSSSAIRNRARELGMRTMREDGLRKVLAGITTPEEVIGITMGDKN
ncbi:MAG: ATPase, T2SS/T4P/T4SS family [Verrucomicrobiota bacterium]|nr:ATPase, T2SS/T4P/T4SS family [Verrucomicrobiota bacterium]